LINCIFERKDMLFIYIFLFIVIVSYILKRLAPYILTYIIKKQFEKFQKKQPPKKDDYKMKSNKKVGEYIDYEEID
jgi:hypothetical protein